MNEEEATKEVERLAKIYGYGHMIAWLRKEWIKQLIQKGFDEKKAKKATEMTPYPQDFNPYQ